MADTNEYFSGRGSQVNTANPYLKHQYVQEQIEGLDAELLSNSKTEYLEEYPKKIVNKVDSPDIGLAYSMNPYQGCEHGCVYCYARNVHQYWGYSAGLDFERKIIVKPEAPELLDKQLSSTRWDVKPIMLSGNTDCYQPAERKYKLTRRMLEVLLKHRHPVGIITKNALVLRDIDVLQELAKYQLVHVMVSITSLDETLRTVMEPRTVTYKNRLRVIEELNKAGVPAGVMNAPLIPGLNTMDIPNVIKAAADHGAVDAGYTIVRLNGAVHDIFRDWLFKNFPDRGDKVWHQIMECHGGKVNDSRYGVRMRGEGKVAESIRALFKMAVKKYMKGRKSYELNCNAFIPFPGRQQLSLF
jgi:DNA repair photolyase